MNIYKLLYEEDAEPYTYITRCITIAESEEEAISKWKEQFPSAKNVRVIEKNFILVSR